MGEFDRYFVEGLKAIWGLREEDGIDVYWRKVRNKVGKEYEYPVARIRRKGGKVEYRHISLALLNASNEIRRRGAEREMQKLLKELTETLIKADDLLEQIKNLSASFNLPIPKDLLLLLSAICNKHKD